MRVEINGEKRARQITTTTHTHTHTRKILRLVNFLSHNNILCQWRDINFMTVKQRKEKENRINVKLFKTQNSVHSRPFLLLVVFFLRLSFFFFQYCCCCCFSYSSSSSSHHHHQFCHFSLNESVRTMRVKQLLIKNIKWIQGAWITRNVYSLHQVSVNTLRHKWMWVCVRLCFWIDIITTIMVVVLVIAPSLFILLLALNILCVPFIKGMNSLYDACRND